MTFAESIPFHDFFFLEFCFVEKSVAFLVTDLTQLSRVALKVKVDREFKFFKFLTSSREPFSTVYWPVQYSILFDTHRELRH